MHLFNHLLILNSNDLHNFDRRDWIPIPTSTRLNSQNLKAKHHFVPEPDWVPPVQSAQQRVPRPRSRGVKLRSVEAIVNDTQRQKSSLPVDERANHSSAKTSPRQQKPAPQPPKSKVLDFLNEITAVSRSNPSSNKATPIGNSTTSQNGVSKKHPTTPIKKPSDTPTSLTANTASSHALKKTSSSSSSSSRQNGIEKSSNVEKNLKSTTSMKTKPMDIDFDILLTKQYLVNDLDDPAATRHLEDLTKINLVKKRPILRVRIALKKPNGRKETSNKKEIKKKITNDTQSHVTPNDSTPYNLPAGTIPTEFIRNMKIPKKSKSDKTPASIAITKSAKANVMELEEGETISPSPSPRYQQNSPPPPSTNRNTSSSSSSTVAASTTSVASKSSKRHREHREKTSGSTEEQPRRSKIARKETSSSTKYTNDNDKEKEEDKHPNNNSNGYTNTSTSSSSVIKKEKYNSNYDDERRPSTSSSKRTEHNSSDDNNEKRKPRRDSGSSRKDEESSSNSRHKSLQKSSSKRRRSRSRSPSRSNSPLRRSSSSSVERSSRRHTPTSKELHKSSSSSSLVKEKSSSSLSSLSNSNINNGTPKDNPTHSTTTVSPTTTSTQSKTLPTITSASISNSTTATTNSKPSIVKNPSSSSTSSSLTAVNDTPVPTKVNKIKYPPATAENADSPDQYRVFSMMFQKLAKFYKRRGDTQEKEIYSILDHFHAFLNYILAFHFIDKQGTDGLNWDTLHPFSVVLIKKIKSWGEKEKKDTLLLGLCLRMNALVHFYIFHRRELNTRAKLSRLSGGSSANIDDQKKSEYAKLADKVFNEHEIAYTNLRDSEKYLSFEDIQRKFPLTYQNIFQLGELGPGIVIGGEAGVSVGPMYPLVPFSKLNHAAIMAKCMLQEYVDREKLNYQPITKVEDFM
ncbi:unnamed protein product [Cunninghamella blakesleeana]